MLRFLTIRRLAVIDSVQVEFDPGQFHRPAVHLFEQPLSVAEGQTVTMKQALTMPTRLEAIGEIVAMMMDRRRRSRAA